MAKSSILFTITAPPGPLLNKSFSISSSETAYDFLETFLLLRNSPNTVTIDTWSTPPQDQSGTMLGLWIALLNDYGYTGLYTVTRPTSLTVKLEAVNDGVVFSLNYNQAPSILQIDIDNQPASSFLTIDSVTFSEATTDPCNNIQVEVLTNQQADRLTEPILIDPTTTNPITFDYPRQTSFNVTVIKDGVGVASKFAPTIAPDILSVNNVTIHVLESPSGATVTINVTNTSLLDIEYSLDDISYQTTNTFSGIALGTYDAYVRDQYGCTVQKQFTVGDIVPPLDVTEPFELVSSENSIRFAKRIISEPCGNYQNSETRLSCEEFINKDVRYKTTHLFNSCDDIKTQFKSNYETINVKTLDQDDNETIIPVTKVTNNIGREDRRDAMFYSLGNGKSGVYYTSGNIYDYSTGLQIDTYSLNGNVPEYGTIGNYIEITGFGTYIIENVIIDEDINVRVLVVGLSYSGATVSTEILCKYSVANFEVYEFSLDMILYNNKTFNVSIEMEDTKTEFEDISYLSEDICVRTDHQEYFLNELLCVEYWNTDNGEILYTGDDGEIRIKHKIRTPVETITIASQSDTEVQNTDTTTILLNASIYQGDEFVFSPVTTEMARRLRNGLVHNRVSINGIGYVVTDTPEVERLGTSNLYTVTSIMTRTGKIYNTDIQGVGNEVPEEQEVFKLLKGDLGFIKST